MREEKSGGQVNHVYGYEYSSSPVWSIDPRTIVNYRTQVDIQRSDVTKVTPDSSGFRNPTPYVASGTVHVPGSIVAQLTSSYFDDHPNVMRMRYYHTGCTGVLRTVNNTSVVYPVNTGLPSIALTGSDWDKHEQRSIMSARNAIADRRAAFAESLAELRSGISDLGKGLKANADILLGIMQRDPDRVLRNFKKVNVKPTSRQRRNVKRVIGNKTRLPAQHLASSLIAIEWGLTPLIEDMDRLAKNIDGKLLSGSLRVNGKGISYEEIDESADSGHALMYNAQVPLRTQRTGRRGVYTSLWFEIDSVGLRTLTQLGLMDLPQVAWAVVPWSFAVDWVIPISTWLKSLTATFGLKYKGGTSTGFVRVRDVTSQSGGIKFVPPNTKYGAPSGTLRITPEFTSRFAMQRKVHPSEPFPDFPSVKDPFGAYQASMSAALLVSQIRALPNSK